MNRIIIFKKEKQEAWVSLKIFEDERDGLHRVTRHMPDGSGEEDDRWAFLDAQNARRQFSVACLEMETLGFKPEKNLTQWPL